MGEITEQTFILYEADDDVGIPAISKHLNNIFD